MITGSRADGEPAHIWQLQLPRCDLKIQLQDMYFLLLKILSAAESVMCVDIKMRPKRTIPTRSGKGNQPLNIKTAVEQPILKLGLPSFR